MKWMIASDLHGSYFYASQMQQAFSGVLNAMNESAMNAVKAIR